MLPNMQASDRGNGRLWYNSGRLHKAAGVRKQGSSPQIRHMGAQAAAKINPFCRDTATGEERPSMWVLTTLYFRATKLSLNQQQQQKREEKKRKKVQTVKDLVNKQCTGLREC